MSYIIYPQGTENSTPPKKSNILEVIPTAKRLPKSNNQPKKTCVIFPLTLIVKYVVVRIYAHTTITRKYSKPCPWYRNTQRRTKGLSKDLHYTVFYLCLFSTLSFCFQLKACLTEAGGW